MDFLKKNVPEHKIAPNRFMIIMEFVPDNLKLYVENLKSPEVQGLPKSQVWDFGEQIMSGLYYLHSFSIAHRDLKPDNILVGKCMLFRSHSHDTSTKLGSEHIIIITICKCLPTAFNLLCHIFSMPIVCIQLNTTVL